MVTLIPVVNVNDRSTSDVWNIIPTSFIVVRLQDLVSDKTFKFNKTFCEIKPVGGIHPFLNFHGKIILSLIMKDKIISNFNSVLYAYVINTLKPDFYTTVDGETYEGEESVSLKEINRCFNETKNLIPLCPGIMPIGQVKGCNDKQIVYHINLLKSLGIDKFVFHTSDFFRQGDPNMILRARAYASTIRKHVKYLILYGMGSQKRLLEFSFADAYATFNHFVTARNGMKYVGVNKIRYSESYKPEIVKQNLREMYNNLKRLDSQKKLSIGGVNLWEAG